MKSSFARIDFELTEVCATATDALAIAETADPSDPVASDAWKCRVIGIVLKIAGELCTRRPLESWRECGGRIERWVLSTPALTRGGIPDVKLLLLFRLFDAHIGGVAHAVEAADVHAARHHAAEMNRPLLDGERCVRSIILRADRADLVDPSGVGGADLEFAIGLLCDAKTELRIRSDDMRLEQARVASLSHIEAGDRLLNEATHDHETLQIELVWMAIDEFRASVVQARDIDIESEAKACSRIGRSFGLYLKLKQRGAKYHERAVDLGRTMHPRVMDDVPWFLEATQAIAEARQVQEANDTSARSARDAAVRSTLIVELAHLKSVSESGKDALLTHIYDKHPPKNASHRRKTIAPDGDDLSMKQQLKKALTHYHPDTAAKEGDEKWRVLCQEIYKYVGAAYETFK